MRSYITQVSVSGILGIPVITDNVFFWHAPVIPNEDYTLIFEPNFWPWSAGSFLLKEIVKEYYHTFAGDPTHYPVDFSLTYIKHGLGDLPSILNIPFGVSTPPNYFTLPPVNQPYWWNGTDV